MDPAGAIGRRTASWDHTMQMWVMQQRRPPTMQHGKEANLCSQMLGIGSYGAQGFGRSLKENVINHLLVLVSDRGNLIRDGEHDMEILAVEKFRLSVFYPVCACE